MNANEIQIPDVKGPMPEYFVGPDAKSLDWVRVPGKGPFEHSVFVVCAKHRASAACLPHMLRLAMFVEN